MTNQTTPHDPSPIFRLIRQVRQLLRGSWVATGTALALAIYLGALLVLALVDLLVPLWPVMRWVALVLVVVPTVWAVFSGVLRPLFRRLGNTQVARRIERHLPGIHNRLVSCVDLSDEKRRNGHSPEFYRRLVSEAIDRIRAFRASTVVDRRNLRRASTALGFALAAFVICWFLMSDRLPTAMARIFQPWADIPPATGVAYTVSPGDAKLLRGDPIEFAAQVTRGEPNDLRIEIVPDDGGEHLWHDLSPGELGRWTRTLEGIETSFHYRVHGGGTWSKQHHITMVDRPRIVDVRTVLHYPEYFGLGEDGVIPQPTPDVTGPETSAVELHVKSEGDVAEAEIQLLEVAWEKSPVAERDERVWFETKIPEGAVAEGNWQWDNEKLKCPAHTEPPAAGVHGHRFHTAPVGFQIEPGEYLFTWVYIVPDQRPETIMLEWHDGQNWEHRAYWGDDKIGVGQPNTTSRQPMGPLPKAGEWVRLEVPARQVGLDGKAIKGMSFTLSGGQCYWNKAGTLPPPTRDQRRLVVKKTFPLSPSVAPALRDGDPVAKGDGESPPRSVGATWSGSFPLLGEGLYRVELRNELKYPNQTMKEAKYAAIPDTPPQVTIERPGADVVLSQPKKLPLTIAAYDDFALKHLRVLVQRGDSGGFREKFHKTFDKQVRGETVLVPLDLASFDLKAGEYVRYRAQVEDRKGQVAETQDYSVRIAADGNSADQQLARFEQTQDTFTQKLAQLIAEQAKVKETVEKLQGEYAPLEKTIEDAEAKAREQARQQAAANPQAPPPNPQVQLDLAATQKLNELRQKLAEAAGKEEQNANVGKQLANELAQAAQQADKLQMLPPELVAEMNAAQQAFDQLAAKPMEELAKQLRQASTPAQNDPNLGEMADASDRLQEELEALAERLKALEKARDNLDKGVEEALAQMREELLKQQAAGAQRGLDDLREMLAALREQLQKFEGQQAEMLDATNVVPDMLLPDLEKRQASLEDESDPPLDEARELVGKDQMARADRRPRFPRAPAMGEEDEMMTSPEEEDTPEDPDQGEQQNQQPNKDQQEMGDEEPLFEPALGGPRPKLDPRFADKRPRPRKDNDEQPPTPAQAERDQLASRQFERLEELNLSQQSLATDERALQELMRELAQALGRPQQPMDENGEMPNPGAPHERQSPEPGAPQAGNQPEPEREMNGQSESELDSETAQQLAELLQSPALREAMAMAQRLRQMQNAMAQAQQAAKAQGKPQKGPAHTSRGLSLGNLDPTSSRGEIVQVELAQLDPQTRAIVLKMQPRLREELLQGMREQGPEGYRKFIQDYFKRLTEVKGQ
ncbi:MAG TPA: hypothetical protein VJ783_18225 [Pirellulales bacterium]|nr:hypothetical protein [Pirellulales bacterium]